MSAMAMGPAMSFATPSTRTAGTPRRATASRAPHLRLVAAPAVVAVPTDVAVSTDVAVPTGVASPVDRPAPSAGSHLRLTTRGRVVLWVLAAAVVALVTLLGSRAAADGPVGAQEVVRHVVQPGETMWQIAETVAGPTDDVRDVVFDLVRLNELPDAGLMAGQVIVVPAG
ncbi:MAG: LysM peptidoglycan-binding domain-containing protein [Cellulomonas sp.]